MRKALAGQNSQSLQTMLSLLLEPMLAAIGFSLLYPLLGGGLAGAVVIFVLLKVFKK